MGIKRIVLVHGSAHGAWCWETVSPLLERLGYEVNALDLPGSGDDLTAAKDVSLGLCIDRVVQEVESGTSPVLLVGHSMAGIIISGVGEAVPQKIGKLVYVAAFLLRSGEAMVGRTTSEESAARAIRPSEIEGAFELDRSMVPDIFYNCCGQEVAARATARLRAQAIGPLTSSSILTDTRWGMTPKTYIVCSRDRALPPAQQHAFCERISGIKKLVMDTDHSPFYSDPQGLVEILDHEARATSGEA